MISVRKAQKVKDDMRRKVQARRTLLHEYGEGPIAAVFKDGKTEERFLCWVHNLAAFPGVKSQRYVEISRLRMKQVNDCIKLAATAHEEGKLGDQGLEIVLDYLYAELNKRLNKTEKAV